MSLIITKSLNVSKFQLIYLKVIVFKKIALAQIKISYNTNVINDESSSFFTNSKD